MDCGELRFAVRLRTGGQMALVDGPDDLGAQTVVRCEPAVPAMLGEVATPLQLSAILDSWSLAKPVPR